MPPLVRRAKSPWMDFRFRVSMDRFSASASYTQSGYRQRCNKYDEQESNNPCKATDWPGKSVTGTYSYVRGGPTRAGVWPPESATFHESNPSLLLLPFFEQRQVVFWHFISGVQQRSFMNASVTRDLSATCNLEHAWQMRPGYDVFVGSAGMWLLLSPA